MPRFHFHLRCGDEFVEDYEGTEHGDLGAARRAGLNELRALAGSDVHAGTLDLRLRIEICDEAGTCVAIIQCADAIEIIPAAPPAEPG